MKKIINSIALKQYVNLKSNKGMELVQVAILIGIAIGLGIIFKDQIASFVNNTFDSLLGTNFS